MLQIPQVFPDLTLMNPFSPHEAPHEFLTHQFPSLTPTKVTPWLSPVPQLENTPLEYRDQLEASTATETTRLWMAFPREAQSLTSVNPEILKGPVACLQVFCLAT